MDNYFAREAEIMDIVYDIKQKMLKHLTLPQDI